MSSGETLELVKGMVNSGEVLDHSDIPGMIVDKHSTGGVGDKTSIAIAPLVAAAGIPVAKLSGRGLGHTGGTLDKLESIPGFQTSLSIDKFKNLVRKNGIALAGQTANLVPADKKLYALRDVTATVENFSLIAASVMSKKIAGGAKKIVLDVKCGKGGFMKTLADASKLADMMVEIGNGMDRETVALISNMDQPLGLAVGNSVEVKEAIDVLRGGGPADLLELSVRLGSMMLVLAGLAANESEGEIILKKKIADGSALEKFRVWVESQGGDPRVADDTSLLPLSRIRKKLLSPVDGYIHSMDCEQIGRASMLAGAGRQVQGDQIDFGAGIILVKKTGDKVLKGEEIAEIIASDETRANAAFQLLGTCFATSEFPPDSYDLILSRL